MNRENRMRGGLIITSILVSALLALPAIAEEGGIVYLPIGEFGKIGTANATTWQIVDDAWQKNFEQAVASMERFPRYLYSGCHDRAHAAYLLLQPALRQNVSKIWVIGPSRYTAGIPGNIGLRTSDRASRAVSWGYHVALAINTRSGVRVFDPVLAPGETLTREQWFALMVPPKLAVWTITAGNVYLFNYATINEDSRNGNQIWNGNVNLYDYLQPEDRIMPDNLARDAVGAAAIAGTTCAAVRELATKPDALLSFLSGGSGSVPVECNASIEMFQTEKARWASLLHN
jgi:hypothetical protein